MNGVNFQKEFCLTRIDKRKELSMKPIPLDIRFSRLLKILMSGVKVDGLYDVPIAMGEDYNIGIYYDALDKVVFNIQLGELLQKIEKFSDEGWIEFIIKWAMVGYTDR